VPREGTHVARGQPRPGAAPIGLLGGQRLYRLPARVAAQARRVGPGGRHLAQGARRPGNGTDRAGDGEPGDLPRRRAGDPRRDRHRLARPVSDRHGTEEQKNRHLGPMLHGDEVWCQMFSEPAAGSDLAAVQTRARQGDDGSWTLNGQKVWTTNAQFASFGLLLARTDPEQHKHKGLTMFIVPMDADGVTVRGLRQISGEAEFNEVFFDDVRLGGDAVVGQVNDGWRTALTTLMFERLTIGIGSEGMGYKEDRFAHAIASDPEARRDPEVRERLGEIA